MRDGIKIALNNTREKYTNVKKIWADMGYQGGNLKNHIKKEYVIDIEIVKRPPCRFWVHKDTPPELLPTREQGFKIQPRRWVVERLLLGLIEGYQSVPNVELGYLANLGILDVRGNSVLDPITQILKS